jgi:hypothetical protein
MEKTTMALYREAKALLDYIENEYVFDKMGDAGCGGVDPGSERFDEFIKAAAKALRHFEEEFPKGSS